MSKALSSTDKTTVADRMRTTVRRGPRHRQSRPLPSANCRESVTDLIARKLNISVAQANKLRWVYPKLIGQAINVLREHGHTEAVAAIIAPIDAACASLVAPDIRHGFHLEAEAENAGNLAEQDYTFDPSPENRDRLLQISAREIMAQQERDNLLRREKAEGR